jgi:translation initiation factor 4A
VDKLSDELTSKNFTVSCLHGEMSMTERELIMQAGRDGRCGSSILITTDVLADVVRGVYPLVINFDLPKNREDYIHRIGRPPARFGRRGVALNFITVGDEQYLDDIREFYRTDIKELENLADLTG